MDMRLNSTNQRGTAKSLAHELKEALHSEILGHIDLFCILWLLLKHRIHIYEHSSCVALLSTLNKVVNNGHYEYSQQVYDIISYDVSLSVWSAVIRRFLQNIRKFFGYNSDKDTVSEGMKEGLSNESYMDCALAIGREPIGLCSVLRRCPCILYSHGDKMEGRNTPEMDFNSLDYCEHDTKKCNKCSVEVTGNKTGIVGIVSPFIWKNEKNLTKSHRKMYKVENGMATSFEKNAELYSCKEFPLHHIFGQGNDKVICSSEDNEEKVHDSSVRIADIIFELVKIINESSDVEINEEIFVLARYLQSEIREITLNSVKHEHDSYDQHCASELFHTNVEDLLSRSNRDLLIKVNCLVPFPTLYWLVDECLISAVSTMESNGGIAELQNMIDIAISEYCRNGSPKCKFTLEKIIKDNLAYICRRLELVHPVLVEILYNLLVNTRKFASYYMNLMRKDELSGYMMLSDHYEGKKRSKLCKHPEMLSAITILNTLRVYGIGGNKDFLRVKCLHAHLAFELAEGSCVGSMMSGKLV